LRTKIESVYGHTLNFCIYTALFLHAQLLTHSLRWMSQYHPQENLCGLQQQDLLQTDDAKNKGLMAEDNLIRLLFSVFVSPVCFSGDHSTLGQMSQKRRSISINSVVVGDNISNSDYSISSDDDNFLYQFCHNLETFLLPSVSLYKALHKACLTAW